MAKNERPYTTGEIASLSHVTINAVKKWINSGKLNAFKTPGGHYRINRDDFRDFISKYRLKIKDELFPEKKKILITDDTPEVVNLLKEAIETRWQDSYEVETAADGYEALIKVGDFKPDLLVLDIRMPRIDGLEVCRRLREQESTRSIKILAITGYGTDEKDRSFKAGADYCLSKPLHMEEFYRWVERLLK